MKNTLKTLLAVAALGTASMVNAALIPATGEVTITQTENNGEYGVLPGSPANGTGGEFLGEFDNGADLYTFCVEKGVHLSNGGTYMYEIAGTITKGTAFLMKEFALGTLAGYSFGDSGVGSDRDADAGDLQEAIWALEGNYALVGNSFYTLATGIVDFSLADTVGEVVRIMLVAQLNTTTGEFEKGNFQDQVVYIPDSGTTLALLGLALGGLAIARRRR